ncbi:MAG: hypothetical protein H7338_24175, partial [Candidatus Sericytochromatia bacterium]|nr:hypothetical protein [Candidatus Sericytochromatia bacterium]
FGVPDSAHPLAVCAQDDQGVTLTAVLQDVVALAKSLDLPSQTFVAWVEARRQALEPFHPRNPETGETITLTDPRWLERYLARGGYEGTYSFGPIAEEAGTAAQVAERQAKALQPA